MSSPTLHACTQVHESHTAHSYTQYTHKHTLPHTIQHTIPYTCAIHTTMYTHSHTTYLDNTQAYTIYTYKTHRQSLPLTSALLVYANGTQNSFSFGILSQDCLLLLYFLGDSPQITPRLSRIKSLLRSYAATRWLSWNVQGHPLPGNLVP